MQPQDLAKPSTTLNRVEEALADEEYFDWEDLELQEVVYAKKRRREAALAKLAAASQSPQRPPQPEDAPTQRRKAVVFAQEGMSQPEAKRLLPPECTISKEREWHHRWKLKWALKHVLVYAWSIHKQRTGEDCPAAVDKNSISQSCAGSKKGAKPQDPRELAQPVEPAEEPQEPAEEPQAEASSASRGFPELDVGTYPKEEVEVEVKAEDSYTYEEQEETEEEPLEKDPPQEVPPRVEEVPKEKARGKKEKEEKAPKERKEKEKEKEKKAPKKKEREEKAPKDKEERKKEKSRKDKDRDRDRRRRKEEEKDRDRDRRRRKEEDKKEGKAPKEKEKESEAPEEKQKAPQEPGEVAPERAEPPKKADPGRGQTEEPREKAQQERARGSTEAEEPVRSFRERGLFDYEHSSSRTASGRKPNDYKDSFNSYIPIWDGNAGSMRKFKKSVTLWLAGLDLERTASYNLAARFLLRQTGAARARGEEEDIDTLAHRPAVADVVGTEIQAADYTHGVWHLVRCFEELCGKTASEKRGELRQKLYVSLRRGPSEPVTNFASTWRTLVAECIAEGIPVTPVESGWLFKERLALTEMQRQLLETATGEEPEFAVVEREVLRLFRRVHLTRSEAAGGSHLRSWRQAPSRPGTVPSSAASTASGGTSRFRRSFNRSRTPGQGPSQAFVTEEHYEDETEEYEDEPEGETEAYETAAEEEDGGEAAADELETELEAMAAALDEGDDLPPEVAEEAAAHLENAGEALVTLREARRQIAAIRKDRGYKAPGAAGSAGGGGRGPQQPSGSQSPGKPSPSKGGRSPKHVHYTETEANVVDFMDHGTSVEVDEFEVMMTLAEALEVSSLPKRGSPATLLGAMDSACNRTCAGPEWIKQALAAIPPEYLSLVVENHEAERFRFGNNQTLVSSRRVRIPWCLEGHVMLLWVSDVPNPKLGCLVGRDCMEALGAVLDFEDHTARFKTLGLGPLRLPQLRAGHLGLPLFPKAGWPAVGGLRSFKPLGRNGVVELQLGFGAWMRLRTKAAWQLMLAVSESFVSEQAVVDSRAALTSTSVSVSKPTSKPAAVLLESVGKWRRMVVRLRERLAWHWQGLLLWLVRMPQLRFAPFPWKSVTGPKEWQEQSEGMVRRGAWPRRWYTRAVENRVFSGVNLGHSVSLRNKCGLAFAFLEDEIVLEGLRALKAPKGVRSRLQRMQLEEAKKAQSEVKEVREERMRALLGPRGGLPRLRAELLELAVLLRVDIEEKDTVETIRKKVTPVARAIALPPPPSQASSSSEVPRPKAPSRTAGPMGTGSEFVPPTRLAAPPMEEEVVPSDDSFRMITSEELAEQMAGLDAYMALRQASASASPAAVHEALQVLANAEEAAAFHDCFVQAADSEVAAHFERRGHGTRAYSPDAYGHVGVFRAKRGAVDRQALENWMVGAASLRAEDRSCPYSNLPAVLDGARDGRYATFWHLRRALPRLFERRFDSFHSTLAVDQQNNLDGGDSRAFENSPDTAGEPPAGGLPFPFRAVENSPDTAGEPLEGQEEQEEMDALVRDAPKPTKEIVQAIAKLHRNTGHVSKRRLARALAVSGAPPVVIRAALELRCEICAEEARPKTRMPASLPRASHFGDRVHGDLFSFKDGAGQTRWVAHWVDVATRYQACTLLRSKTAQEVGATLAEWTRIFGAPKTLVVDMGPEFVAESFQDLCDFYDTVLHHIPVEAPWRNGVAERAGASTKAVLQRLVKEYLPVTEGDVSQVVTAAAGAYNDDINDSGYSPSQAVGLAQTALTNEPSFCRALAIRETARVAMLRLHYSQAMSKALLARSRAPHPEHYNAGDVVYFYRRQKSKPGKKLQLKAWHGPALVVAMEGPDENQLSAYGAYRGNVTKVAIEHLRKASALERLAATDWAPALQTVLNEVTDAPEPVPTETTAEAPAEEVPAVVSQDRSRRPSLSSLAPWEKESHSVYRKRSHESVTAGESSERPASKAKPLGEPVVGEPMDGTSEALGLRDAAVESAAPSAPELVPIPEETVGESPGAQSSHEGESTAEDKDHPLVRLMEQVAEDRQTGYEEIRCGTWDGRWPTPSEVQRKRLQATGDLMTLPVENEACLASAGKEITWSRLDVKTKDAFQKAADEQWQKWTENGSVQELSVEESRRVQADLKRSGKSGDLLTPRVGSDRQERGAVNPGESASSQTLSETGGAGV
ncbi:tenm3 [Symbiodinium sp. CCMP2592]|nr:tenm3 [Symbiodinium sp. CCMP2592]